MGGTGEWNRTSCPPKYLLNNSIKSGQHTTRAELLGGIDGFVLGKQLPVWLHGDPTLKLSTVLERYYGTGINDVSKDVRFDQFQVLSLNKDKVIEQTTLACKDIQRKAAIIKFFHDTSFCKEVAKEAVNKFYKSVLQSSDSTFSSSSLPNFETLVKAYPGQLRESDPRKQIGGSLQIPTGRAATEALRLSMMLNKMAGHHITLAQATGAVIGRDKKVYIHDLTALKKYLTQKYKAPETATSVSALSGKSGILILDPSVGSVGSVGLWDGSKMHQTPDYSRQPNVAMNLWTSSMGCDSLAELGNCDFYNCVEAVFPCGNGGYALGYGNRYCHRFIDYYDKFDTVGKEWVDAVRKCLMKKLAPSYKRGSGCDTIKRTAFAMHADCYLSSGVGFCKMSLTNKAALWDVFQLKDLVGKDSIKVWMQVVQVGLVCRDKIISTSISKVYDIIMKKVHLHKCVAYAKAGDCRFYQCFHEKFLCNVFDTNHMTDFEFPLCKDMERQSDLFDSKGNTWLTENNRCLMRKLLPLYKGDSINCADLHTVTFQNRIDCLANTNYCGVADITGNQFALDRITNLKSYPALLPDKAGLTMAGRDYFYGELSSVRHLMRNKDVC